MGSLAKNLSYNYIGTLTVSILGFLATPLLIRYLGVETFGAWVLLGSILAYASLFDLGAGLAAMKLIAEHDLATERQAINRLFSNVFATYIALGGVFLLAAACLYPLLSHLFAVPAYLANDFRLAYLIVVGAAAISFSGASLTATLQGVHDFKTQNMVVVLQTLASTLALVASALLTRSLVWVALTGTIVNLIAFLIKFWLVRRKGIMFNRRFIDRAVLRKIFHFGSAVFIINIAARIVFDTDALIIGAFLGTAAVASYQVALGPNVALRKIGDQLNSVTLTASSRLHATRKLVELRALYRRATKYSLLIMLPFIMGTLFLGRDLLRTWVGPEFESSYWVLVCLAVGISIVNLQSTAAQLILSMGEHRRLAIICGIEAVANLGLSILLLHHLGITGVALGTLIPTALTAFLYTMPVATRKIGLSYRQTLRDFLVPFAASLLAAPFLFAVHTLTHPTNLLQVLAAGTVYAGLYGAFVVLLDKNIRALALVYKKKVFGS